MVFGLSLWAQLVGRGLGAPHRGVRPRDQAGDRDDGHRISGGDERPGIHSAADRRRRASTLASASSARMRISATPAKIAVRPTSVSGSGHWIELSMLDPRMPMLEPW